MKIVDWRINNMVANIEELLLYSWLKDQKGCQLVQRNWKPVYNTWKLKNEDIIDKLMINASSLFWSKYNFQLFTGSASLPYLLQQTEIDVVGIKFNEKSPQLFAIDISTQKSTKENAIDSANAFAKKIIHNVICLMGYFSIRTGEIILSSPTMNDLIMGNLNKRISDIQTLLENLGLDFKMKVMAKDDFNKQILQPALASSLFGESIKYKVDNKNTTQNQVNIDLTIPKKITEYTPNELTNEMKIGELVRKTLTKMLENHEISPNEIESMQTTRYSKEVFDIQYPLLRKADLSNGKKVERYWKDTVRAYGERYFICSEWYEVEKNNDRPYFMKWLNIRTGI